MCSVLSCFFFFSSEKKETRLFVKEDISEQALSRRSPAAVPLAEGLGERREERLPPELELCRDEGIVPRGPGAAGHSE